MTGRRSSNDSMSTRSASVPARNGVLKHEVLSSHTTMRQRRLRPGKAMPDHVFPHLALESKTDDVDMEDDVGSDMSDDPFPFPMMHLRVGPAYINEQFPALLMSWELVYTTIDLPHPKFTCRPTQRHHHLGTRLCLKLPRPLRIKQILPWRQWSYCQFWSMMSFLSQWRR